MYVREKVAFRDCWWLQSHPFGGSRQPKVRETRVLHDTESDDPVSVHVKRIEWEIGRFCPLTAVRNHPTKSTVSAVGGSYLPVRDRCYWGTQQSSYSTKTEF